VVVRRLRRDATRDGLRTEAERVDSSGKVSAARTRHPESAMMILVRIEFELVEPALNARRYDAMFVRYLAPRARQLPLFPHFDLITARARLERKHKPVIRRERFFDLDRLRARWNELLARRRQHGYVITREEP
jgi:hypothetical protein